MADGAEFETRDLIKEPLTRQELLELAAEAGGLELLVAKRSPSYKKYRDQMTTEDGIIDAMLAEPRLIRRPILRGPDGVYIGFQADQWAARAK